MLEKIKEQVGSNGEKGWPVTVKDRFSYACGKDCELSDANVGVTFLWTMRDVVIPELEKDNLAIATNFLHSFRISRNDKKYTCKS